MPKKYEHLFDVGFGVVSDKAVWEDVTPEELMAAFEMRVIDVRQAYRSNPNEVLEIFGGFETTEIDDED